MSNRFQKTSKPCEIHIAKDSSKTYFRSICVCLQYLTFTEAEFLTDTVGAACNRDNSQSGPIQRLVVQWNTLSTSARTSRLKSGGGPCWALIGYYLRLLLWSHAKEKPSHVETSDEQIVQGHD